MSVQPHLWYQPQHKLLGQRETRRKFNGQALLGLLKPTLLYLSNIISKQQDQNLQPLCTRRPDGSATEMYSREAYSKVIKRASRIAAEGRRKKSIKQSNFSERWSSSCVGDSNDGNILKDETLGSPLCQLRRKVLAILVFPFREQCARIKVAAITVDCNAYFAHSLVFIDMF